MNTAVAKPVLTSDRKKRPITKRQRELVDVMVSRGVDHVRASEIMGAERSWAWKSVRKANVQEALRRGLDGRMIVAGTQALDVMIGLMQAGESEQTRLVASKDLLDRAGITNKNKDLTSLNAGELRVTIDLS